MMGGDASKYNTKLGRGVPRHFRNLSRDARGKRLGRRRLRVFGPAWR